MSFVRYKQRGNKWYVYEVSNLWNKETKKYYQDTVYLGVANEKGGEYVKAKKRYESKPELAIVDFGDGFAIQQMLESSGLSKLLEANFKDSNTVQTLLAYQLTQGSAMHNCLDWAEGNAISKLLPKTKLTSQEISKIIQRLGDETVQRNFFKSYINTFFQEKHGVLIDSTAMPSSINSSLSSWGYSTEGIQEMVNCLMLVDKKNKMPIYYRAIAGDIADVSTLETTIDEISRLGLKMDQAIFDAGYFSEANIKYLCQKDINFISRIPKSRNVFKDLIKGIGNVECLDNAVVYGKRAVFIDSKEIELYGHKIYAHVIFDPNKKAKDTTKLVLQKEADPSEIKDYVSLMESCGYFVLVSRAKIEKKEIMPSYYARQGVEQIFGFAKNNSSLLPLRVHSNQSINGYLLLVFISIALFVMIREKLNNKWTVEQALNILRCHKAKIYDKEMVPTEARKKDKDIYAALNITVPKSCGI